MPVTSIDPSLAIGFYCRTRADFNDFIARARDMSKMKHPVFYVADVAPSYGGDSDDEDGEMEAALAASAALARSSADGNGRRTPNGGGGGSGSASLSGSVTSSGGASPSGSTELQNISHNTTMTGSPNASPTAPATVMDPSIPRLTAFSAATTVASSRGPFVGTASGTPSSATSGGSRHSNGSNSSSGSGSGPFSPAVVRRSASAPVRHDDTKDEFGENGDDDEGDDDEFVML
jgi:hypothetical protein